MEYPRAPLLPTPRLQCLAATHWSAHGYTHHLSHLSHRPRDRHGVHHEEDKGVRVPSADEPVADRDVTEDEVD